MLTFKDFIPQVQKRVLGMATAYESIHEVLTRVNRWMESEQIQVFNVETLLLPEHPKDREESPPAYMTSAGYSYGTYQTIRVWYREQGGQRPYTGVTQQLDSGDIPSR
ncbi:MAG TPA: hypothetical protein VGE07_29740 [Herpetosiphonaceae bacterium]